MPGCESMPSRMANACTLGTIFVLLLASSAIDICLANCNCYGSRNDLPATDEPQTITSPGFPDVYRYNCRCLWLITSQKQYVTFTVESGQLEPAPTGDGCAIPYLTFYDGYHSGEKVLTIPCNPGRRPATFTSTSEYVYITFKNVLPVPSFKVKFQASGHDIDQGVRSLKASDVRRTLTSPQYPQPYPRNYVAQWRITSQKDVVELTVEDLKLESGDDNACYDTLKIYDGSDFNAHNMTSLCVLPSNKANRVFTSTSKHVYILFTSNLHTQERGFKISYKAKDCKATQGLTRLQATPGYATLTSPGYPVRYPPNANMEWVITSSQDIVKFFIEDMNLEYFRSCYSDAVEIYEGTDSSGRRLANLCSMPKDRLVISRSKTVYIRFKSDGAVQRTGFRIGFQSDSSRSGAHCPKGLPSLFATSKYQSVSAPTCDSETFCEWLITSDRGFVHVSIEYIDPQLSSDCEHPMLEVYDGVDADGKLLAKLCSFLESSPHPSFLSSSNQMFIRYKPLGEGSDKGIKFGYQTEQPGLSARTTHLVVGLSIVGAVAILTLAIFIIYRRRGVHGNARRQTDSDEGSDTSAKALPLNPPPYTEVTTDKTDGFTPDVSV